MLVLVVREERDHERLDVSKRLSFIIFSLRAITLAEPLFWCCFVLSLIIPRPCTTGDLHRLASRAGPWCSHGLRASSARGAKSPRSSAEDPLKTG